MTRINKMSAALSRILELLRDSIARTTSGLNAKLGAPTDFKEGDYWFLQRWVAPSRFEIRCPICGWNGTWIAGHDYPPRARDHPPKKCPACGAEKAFKDGGCWFLERAVAPYVYEIRCPICGWMGASGAGQDGPTKKCPACGAEKPFEKGSYWFLQRWVDHMQYEIRCPVCGWNGTWFPRDDYPPKECPSCSLVNEGERPP
jgi:endogenous inhibitor of DNA gyrase (YacG/DUF329 family)